MSAMKRYSGVEERRGVRTRLAMVAVGLGLAALLAAPGQSWAQGEEDKSETDVKVFKRDKPVEEVKAEEGKKGPRFKAKAAEREFKLQAQQKRDEAIRLLGELIDATDDKDAEKPEFLFQLSELLWEKSKYYEQSAYKTQDEMYGARDRGDKATEERLKQRMKDELAESQRQREEAVKLYVQIINNHKNYKQLADVYFYLGANLLEIGKQAQALQVFKQLTQIAPDSPYMPNVLLAFGEYYFENDDMEQASKAYRKVTEFKEASVYTYALYKMAWCEYNAARYDVALDTFMAVVQETERRQRDLSLRKEALKDIVLTYSHIGKASKALALFKKMVKQHEDVMFMGEALAQLYADNGNVEESTDLFRNLIALNSKSFKVVDYQLEIVRNVEKKGNKIETVRELQRAIKLLDKYKDAADAEKQAVSIAGERLELLLREYATTYHREAQKTRNDETYALAYNLYKDYLDHYPESKDRYAMTFFYAEMLYRLGKFDESAERYEQTLDIQKEGEYHEEAVHAAVLSYQKLVQISDEREPPPADELKTKPVPKEIPAERLKLIKACDRYAKVAPDSKSLVKVKYSAARTYYDYNHFPDAIARFQDIVKNHTDHRLAVISADLHLDSLNLMQDYEGLADAVMAYIKNPTLAQGEFLVRLNGIAEQTAFNKCVGIEGRKEWEAAAECFTEFCNQFPDSEVLDKALYNAALDFERLRMIGKAIRMRKFLLKYRDDSPLVPETLFSMAGNYHALAVYSEASKYYEMFFQFFPSHEKAEQALANAATFRQGLGDYKEAIANYEKYLQIFPTKKEKGAEVFFQIGVIYEQEGRAKDAFEIYSNYIAKWGKVGKMDRLLEARGKIAMIHWKANRQKQAIDEFNTILKTFEGLRENQRAELDKGADAAAQARFMIGEVKLVEMEKIKLKLPEKLLKERLTEKIKVLGEVNEIYRSVFNFGRPDWTIAALYRLGYVAQSFASEIRNSPVPSGLPYDIEEQYKIGLEEQASQIDQAAIKAYEDCLDVALQQSWFNEFSTKAEVALAGLKPKVYRKPSELRAKPFNSREGFVRSKFSRDALADEEDKTMKIGDDGGTN